MVESKGGDKLQNPIKKARISKGFRQKELAERLGVSPVAVCRWEQGKAFPKVERLKTVAEVLDTTVEELLPEGKEVS